MNDREWEELRIYAEKQGVDFDSLVKAALALVEQAKPGPGDGWSDVDVRQMVAAEMLFECEEK